jgi:hypothetical protein
MEAAVIKHICDHGKIHAPDNEGMRFCKHFQVTAFKKLSLAFIMDLFELHSAKITQKIFRLWC